MTYKTRRKILVVDDDRHILELLEARLSAAGYEVVTSPSGQKALEILDQGPIDLLIADVRMPGMTGMELLQKVRKGMPRLPVILLTAYGTIPDAVQAMKDGAVDYLTKPFDGRDLLWKVEDTLHQTPSLRGSDADREALAEELWGGESGSMQALYELIARITKSDVNVLILGESGVGKERVARLIHQRSSRSDKPFVVVDCGSTPTSLLESELFGHVRGSFTHAIRDKKGLIEAADQGTLFLDEIGNISPEMQIRLLRFLEDRKIRRIGDVQEIPVDCRIISATNLDLPREVEGGRFREDLYYRLRVVTLRVPALRERKKDIPLLARRFVDMFREKHGISNLALPAETIEWLQEYPWPGNVRELKNALEAGVVMCSGGDLRPKDLHSTGLPDNPSVRRIDEDSLLLEESERNLILRALQQAGWVQKDAATLLGISRRALHYKIRKFNIEIPGRSSESFVE